MAFHRQISQSLEIVSNIQRKNFDLNVRHRGSRPSIFVRSFGSFTTERVCFFLLKKAHISLCLLQVIARCASRGLYDWDKYVRQAALGSIRQQLDGRPIPGYQWVPLRKRREQERRLKRIAFWLSMTAVMLMIGLVATWLLGVLDPNGFPVRFLAVLAGIVAFVAAVAQVLGRTLRDPWEHS